MNARNPILQNRPRQVIEKILSFKQERRPLPFLLSLSFFYATVANVRVCCLCVEKGCPHRGPAGRREGVHGAHRQRGGQVQVE